MAKRKTEKTKEELRKLTLMADNKFCMDCGMRGPLYVVLDFHTFVCSQCSAIHRGSQHKVKGISMSEFTEDELAGMKSGGNGVAKQVWLSNFRGSLPREGDERAVKDHIRHIYEEKRHYDSNAAKTATLPPVVPLPAHLVPHLEKPQQPAAPTQPAPTPVVTAPTPVVTAPTPVVTAPTPVVTAPAPVVTAPAPVVTAPAPTPQVVQQPAAPAQPQAQANVFDTIFQPGQPQQAPQQQPQPAPHHPDPFAGVQATPPVQQQQTTQPPAGGGGGMDFFAGSNAQPAHPQDMGHQQGGNAQYAAQVQMHSTQYQQTGNAYGAQGQMSNQGTNYATSQAPPQSQTQHDMWGAQTAQVQMAPPQAAPYNSGTPYAAQHQMNSTGTYGQHQQPQGGAMNFMAPMGQPQQQQQQQPPVATGPVDFFAQQAPAGGAPPQQQYNQQPQQQHQPQGGAIDPFFGGGPPPISAGQHSHAPVPLAGTGTTSNGHASPPPKAKGPDPFASLDFFGKK